MKKIAVFFGILFSAFCAFSQQETNGTLYIKHPNIDAVNKAGTAYTSRDVATLRNLYLDTARYWASGMPTFILSL